MPSACSICASIWRASSVNSTSPSATLAPSSKCTCRMVVSTRDFSATLEIGVTVPIESTSTGTGLRSALATSTEMTRGRWGPCALAPLPVQEARVRKAASAAMPSTAATNIRLRFFIAFQVSRSGRTGTARSPALEGDICAFSKRLSQPCPPWYAIKPKISDAWDLFDAYCFVERQLGPATDRASLNLAEGLRASHRLSAGDQMPRRGIPAGGDRGARLQRGYPRPESVQWRRAAFQAAVRRDQIGARRRSRGHPCAISGRRGDTEDGRAPRGVPVSAQREPA